MIRTFILLILIHFIWISAIGQACPNWLHLPSTPSYAEAGELDVSGDKITVEATFNRTAPYSGGQIWAGDLVSKHKDPTDANYLLRPNTAEITTSNGYFRTPDVCEIELNKTYHVAMVYDGKTLKFYRNGFLLSQINATGTLYQNDWKTQIGYYEPAIHPENFVGYISEVRIWNVARTQQQIRTYMNAQLPAPSTQTGLLAYYTFNDLENKQGNNAYDLTLSPDAELNSNPNCNFVEDSCGKTVIPPDKVIITNDTTICRGSTLKLATVSGLVYHWTPSTYLDDPNSPTPTTNTPVDITYSVEAYFPPTNTTIHESITIKVKTAFIETVDDTTVCSGAEVPLNATPGLEYSWSPSTELSNSTIANPVATPSSTVKYVVTGTDIYGCKATDAVEIRVLPKPSISIMQDSMVCPGDHVELWVAGGQAYKWFPEAGLTNPYTRNPNTTVNHDKTYTARVTDANGCVNEDSVSLKIRPFPDFRASLSQQICGGNTLSLTASGGDNYLWTSSDQYDDATSPIITPSPISSTTYTVNISENACHYDTTINIDVTVRSLPEFSSLPNAFTPNGDGKNDCFGIRHWGDARVEQFTVYNRWGQIVFSSKDPSECWDGTLNGIPQPQGGYVYIIRAGTVCGLITHKSILTLIR